MFCFGKYNLPSEQLIAKRQNPRKRDSSGITRYSLVVRMFWLILLMVNLLAQPASVAAKGFEVLDRLESIWADDERESDQRARLSRRNDYESDRPDFNALAARFCAAAAGKQQARIQNGLLVDCLTAKTLWAIAPAAEWPAALSRALRYGIYDDYLGEATEAPLPGVALILSSSTDYKAAVQLKQIVRFYELPVYLEAIDDYSQSTKTD